MTFRVLVYNIESPLLHVKHVTIKEMKDIGIITNDDCLATAYLRYAGSLANTRYIKIENAVRATAISTANDNLKIVFIGLIL